MARLIDADELNIIKEKLRIFDSFISSITRQYTDEHLAIYEHWIDCRYDIEKVIDEQPTAYDIEEVVAELEEAKEKIAKEDYCRTKDYIENDCEHKDCFKCCAEYLIDIVKAGGVENEDNC